SSSVDVKHHIIYRRSAGQPGWTEIARFDIQDTTHQHIDSLVVSRTRYEYAMVAEDSSGLRSVFSKVIPIITLPTESMPITKVVGRPERERKIISLTWNTKSTNIKKYLIYRSVEDEPMVMYSSI